MMMTIIKVVVVSSVHKSVTVFCVGDNRCPSIIHGENESTFLSAA